MLQNAYFLAKIGADTAENEQHFAEILPTDAPCRASASTFRLGERLREHLRVGAERGRPPARRKRPRAREPGWDT